MVVTSTDVRNKLPEALNRVVYSGERVEITRHGKVIGVIISKADADLLDAMEDEHDVAEAKKVIARAKRKGEKPIPYSEARKAFAKGK
ncbi:MAG: type II toxin-antitoxin system prevent-host-death family antitoxin [Candidatus Riflebacteria bacterium]|nr:type II toxin-antitoxin system prevent-host-death family antitoxin [Candidatus Riflebacteria bacterium]